MKKPNIHSRRPTNSSQGSLRKSVILEAHFSENYIDRIKRGVSDSFPNKEVVIKEDEKVIEQKEFAELTLPDGRQLKIPIIPGTCGPKSLDIRGFYSKTNMTFYDPGFTSTASCHSAITYIDGRKGELLHRGYHIMDLCEHSNHVELIYLLLYGELPTKQQLEDHTHHITYHTLVHEKLIEFYKGFKSDAHPMAIMCGVVGALSSFYHDSTDIHNPTSRLLATYRLVAKMPNLAAMAYKTSIGQPFIYPQNSLSYAENFLYMLFALPTEEFDLNPVMVRAMDKFLMLHADHEQNASTSTVRIAGSSHANPFACIASGISSLWGPAHGGANEACVNMLEEIGCKENIQKYIAKAKDKKDPFRLMGFGHRVYKNYDPRARVMQKMCHELLDNLQMKDPFFELAMELEKVALSDEYFKKRKLFPNVDFYSGVVLRAIGIPKSMFTVLFAVGRTIGWIANWKEMIEDPKQRIGRPRQVYVGAERREFIPIGDRGDEEVQTGMQELKKPKGHVFTKQ